MGYVDRRAHPRALVTWSLLTVVALIAGMNIDGSGVDLFGLFGLAVIVNLTATLWAAGMAMRIRSIQAGPLMQMPVFLILFLAPVYVPLGLLTGWIHAVARGEPGHGAARGRPRLHLGQADHGGAGLRRGVGLALLFASGRAERPAERRGGRRLSGLSPSNHPHTAR